MRVNIIIKKVSESERERGVISEIEYVSLNVERVSL